MAKKVNSMNGQLRLFAAAEIGGKTVKTDLVRAKEVDVVSGGYFFPSIRDVFGADTENI